MCGSSKTAKRTISAKEKETYTVESNHYGQGAFVPHGETVESCIACVKGNTQMVTFSNLPKQISKELGSMVVDGKVVGRFIEVETGNHETSRDMIAFGKELEVDFVELVGATAYMGIHESLKPKSVAALRSYENA